MRKNYGKVSEQNNDVVKAATKPMCQTISDIISDDDVRSWTPDELIFISAGTGRGKSYFIKNRLNELVQATGGKILMILHRRKCCDQFYHELEVAGKLDQITVTTYQAIEECIFTCGQYDFSQYTHIVCDEFHYFLSDADFSNLTGASLSAILAQNDKVRIFLSATGEAAREYILSLSSIPQKEYVIEDDTSRIAHLRFFNSYTTIRDIGMRTILRGKKAVFFLTSTDKALKVKRMFERKAAFNCSPYNSKYSRYINKKAVDELVETGMMKTPILVTTMSLEAGMNILDPDVDTIVVDNVDINTVIQCIGRRRFDRNRVNDKINVYIKSVNNTSLSRKIDNRQVMLDASDYLKEYGSYEFMRKYPNGRLGRGGAMSYAAIPTVKTVPVPNQDAIKWVPNDISIYKYKLTIAEYTEMLKEDYGWCKALARKLGFFDEEYGIYTYEVVNEDESLEEYLESHVGEIYPTIPDRAELINKIDLVRGCRQMKNIETLNGALAECKSAYRIEKLYSKGHKNAWTIVRHSGSKSADKNIDDDCDE